MNIEDFRGYCMSFKGVHEKCHFQTWLTSTVVTFYAFMSRTSDSVLSISNYLTSAASNAIRMNPENCRPAT